MPPVGQETGSQGILIIRVGALLGRTDDPAEMKADR